MKQFLKLSCLLLFLIARTNGFCGVNGLNNTADKKEDRGFHFGLYVGSFFANQKAATLYNGWGIDPNTGNQYYGDAQFSNSLMEQKILQYSGQIPGSYLPDLITPQLGVPTTGDWIFGPGDMPAIMRYQISFMMGFNSKYNVDKNNAIIFNFNVAILKITGAFTIETPNQQPVNSMYPTPYQLFPIIGGEQRFMAQLGYQKVIGKNPKLNPVIEGGLNFNYAQFGKNFIRINTLNIDLTNYYNSNPYSPFIRPRGAGLGAFAGIGLHLTMSPKWTVQLLWSPSYDKVNFGVYITGDDNKPKFQNAAGLRFYYNL